MPSAENATELACEPLSGCIGIRASPRKTARSDRRRRIPEPDRAVTAGRRQRAAVGGKRHAPDSTRMSEERDLTGSRREVPEPKGATAVAHGEGAAIGSERQGAARGRPVPPAATCVFPVAMS